MMATVLRIISVVCQDKIKIKIKIKDVKSVHYGFCRYENKVLSSEM